MTTSVLFISPDYASHYYPMSAIARVLHSRGNRVVFATGNALRARVLDDGFEHSDLILGPGNNAGLLRTRSQSTDESSQMETFFEASRLGMVPALKHQAKSRLSDLLFEPERVTSDISTLIDACSPDVTVADHLAFGATAALRGLGQPFMGFHPGHPSAIPVDVPYGYPPHLPIRIKVDETGLKELKELCVQVSTSFTNEYNRMIQEIDPGASQLDDAFKAVSPHGTIVNYPSALGTSYGLPTSVRFIGSSVRKSRLTPELAPLFAEPRSRPRIYVSLGSFFSERTDILRKIVTAFRREPVEVVMARGVTPLSELGDIPSHWTIAEHLPQPAVISQSSLVITHGGNNTVTEALTAGVPLLIGPLSTDQFAAAADIEAAGLGRAFDPNHDSASTVADLASEVMSNNSLAASAIGQSLRARPGEVVAADLIEQKAQLDRSGREETPSHRV